VTRRPLPVRWRRTILSLTAGTALAVTGTLALVAGHLITALLCALAALYALTYAGEDL
jgi:hypothetical protein